MADIKAEASEADVLVLVQGTAAVVASVLP
jgi:hypothetical protein